MAKENAQRILNLLLVLKNAKRPLTIAEIFELVPQYDDPTSSAEQKMFERDKSELREYVVFKEVAVEGELANTYSLDISESFFEVNLTEAERILIAIALKGWRQSALDSTARTVLPLTGYAALENPPVLASLGRGEVHLATLQAAIREKKVVTFSYESRNSQQVKVLRMHPWQLAFHDRHWYLHGFEEVRGAGITIRLTRIVGDVEVTKLSATAAKPESLDTVSMLEEFRRTETATQTAQIEVPKGDCANLRIRAGRVDEGDSVDTLWIDYEDANSLATDIAVVCDRAKVLSPQQLRDRVTDSIKRVLQVHQ